MTATIRSSPITILIVAASIFTYLAFPSTTSAQQLYWTNLVEGKIQRANTDGSGIQDVLTGLTNPSALAIDLPSQTIYWSQLTPNPTLHRASLDGSNPQTLLTTDGRPLDIALDPAGGKIYWSEYYGKLRRANLDGSSQEDIITVDPNDTSGNTGTSGSTLLITNDKLYFPNASSGQIRRSNLDGSNIEVILPNLGGLWGLAADASTQTLYFIDEDDNLIGRFPPDDLDQLRLFSINNFLGGDSYPNGLTIDPHAGLLYWSEGASDSIYRLNTDGSNPQLVLHLDIPRLTSDGSLRRLVLVPEPASLALLLFSASPLFSRRRKG
jgi:sugar lactone lactonase YvrE